MIAKRRNITHTTYNVGTLDVGTPRRGMAEDPWRFYLLVANHDTTNGVWLHIGNTAPTAETGAGMIYLAPGGYYEREGDLCPDEALWLVAEGDDVTRYTIIGGSHRV